MSNILIGAVIFSMWFTILFVGNSIGPSMLLFVLPVTLYLLHILKKHNEKVNTKAIIILIPILLLSSTYFIYNNIYFRTLNLIIIPILVITMIVEYIDKNLSIKMLGIKVLEVIFRPFDFMGETIIKAEEELEEKFKNENKKTKNKKRTNIIIGILITIPIVLIIIILLATADEIFGKIFIDAFKNIIVAISDLKIYKISLKIVVILITFLYFSAFLYTLLYKYEKENETKKEVKEKDNTTIKMILGTLNVIYLFFCIVQIKSLFMGRVDINYAKYARQGFFQLMIVSLINLVTILIAKKNNRQRQGIFNFINIMSLLMIIFTYIILFSSAMRMYFYERTFGYTYLRLLVYCILLTEAVLLIPTIYYVINEKINLAKSYFIITICIYVGMNFANFDKMIAKRNIDRYQETGKIDIDYLVTIPGTDAISEMVRLLEIEDDTDEHIQLRVEKYLEKVERNLDKKMDFRSFNISKKKAEQLL